jgi:ubiquinone/menaquinone biosynthesis C-methylase UbiE
VAAVRRVSIAVRRVSISEGFLPIFETQNEIGMYMTQPNWKEFWEAKASRTVSDLDFDRGAKPRDGSIDQLANEELLAFIDCKSTDVVFDAGCGTGMNLVLLHSKIHRIIGMDYAQSAVARCRNRLLAHGIKNVDLLQGDVTRPPLPASAVDTILCMSVLQYLNDEEVRSCFRAFAAVLKNNGVVILHVKNLASLYLASLWTAKKLLRVMGKKVKLEHFRPYRWYRKELESAGFEIVAYNSFNLLVIEKMPQRLLSFLQRLELTRRNSFPYTTAFARRHGSDLKIRARIRKT